MNLSEHANPTGHAPRPNAGAWPRRCAIAALVVVGLVLISTSMIFVDETESVIVERFGNIVQVYDRDVDRGAHFKLPWPVDLARRFDRRVQLFDPPGREMFTSDKKNVTVDVYVCWRIAEPTGEATPLAERPLVRFYRGLGSVDLADARLDSRIRSILTTTIGQVELSRLLGVKNSEQGPAAKETGPLEKLAETVRSEAMCRPSETESLRDRLGIEIVDLRITRLNLPTGNQQAVFERMKSERKKIADRYRSAGMADNQMIRSQADRQYNEILARTKADAERIRGTAEAEAGAESQRRPMPRIRVLHGHHHARRVSQDPQRKDHARPSASRKPIEDVDRRRTAVETAGQFALGPSQCGVDVPDSPKDAKKDKQAVPLPKVSSLQGGR